MSERDLVSDSGRTSGVTVLAVARADPGCVRLPVRCRFPSRRARLAHRCLVGDHDTKPPTTTSTTSRHSPAAEPPVTRLTPECTAPGWFAGVC